MTNTSGDPAALELSQKGRQAQKFAGFTVRLPSAKKQVLRHQRYHRQCRTVCVKMTLVTLPSETPNPPNPIPYEDSIASVRVYWKAVLVPGGSPTACKQQQKKKKKKS